MLNWNEIHKAMTADGRAGDHGGIKEWKTLNIGQGAQRPLELQPHEKLFLAILMDAVETLKKDANSIKTSAVRNKKSWLEAERWLISEDEEHVFSFVCICEYFKWDVSWVRKKILQYVERAHQENKPSAYARRHRMKVHRDDGPVSVRAKKREGAEVA